MGCKQVNQSVFTVCPPEMRIKPSMVFVFELFILKKDGTPFDRPLAWGVFPMLNSGADASCYVGEIVDHIACRFLGTRKCNVQLCWA